MQKLKDIFRTDVFVPTSTFIDFMVEQFDEDYDAVRRSLHVPS